MNSIPPAGLSLARRPMLALDVTALWNSPTTGIQRVIRETTPFLAKAAADRCWDVGLVGQSPRGLALLARWSGHDPSRERRDLDRIANGVAPESRRDRLERFLMPMGALARTSGLEWMARRLPGAVAAARAARNLSIKPAPLCESADAYLSFSAGILPSAVPANVPSDRTVFILHDLIPLHHPRFMSPQVVREFVANIAAIAFGPHVGAARFVAASRHVAVDIDALFHSLARRKVAIDVVDWGYDAATFFRDPDPGFRRGLGIPADAVVVVAVSSQDPRKRFTVIEAAARRLGIHAVFIGRGRPRREGNAIYLGHVPDNVVRRAYSSCDVVVNWSAAEGFGLPIIEALACDARVVVPPDNPTLIEVGGSNVVVAPQANVEGLSLGIENALRKPAAADVDLSRFQWRIVSATLEELLFGRSIPRNSAVA